MIEKLSMVCVEKIREGEAFPFVAVSLCDLEKMIDTINQLTEAYNELSQGLKEVKEKDYIKVLCGEKQPETTPVIETEYIDKGKVFDTMYDLLFDEKKIPTKQDILAVIENAPAERVVKNG